MKNVIISYLLGLFGWKKVGNNNDEDLKELENALFSKLKEDTKRLDGYKIAMVKICTREGQGRGCSMMYWVFVKIPKKVDILKFFGSSMFNRKQREVVEKLGAFLEMPLDGIEKRQLLIRVPDERLRAAGLDAWRKNFVSFLENLAA